MYEERYSKEEREKKGMMVGGGFGPVSYFACFCLLMFCYA
jgi:hypothetical protein